MAKNPSQKGNSADAPHRALYRKYRPTSLDSVVGQDQVTTPLKNALKDGKISHAYLFIGPRGTGKTSVARIFAHAVNGFEYQIEDSYLDIIEIDAASNTGVDNIRELREKAVIAPTKGKYKVYIIDEVHMLTKSASNALLKTLEEPPEHVIFIMATTDAYKVPITISSRTQVHTFRLADAETMQAHLRQIADTEQIPITNEALSIVVRRGGGSFRDSLSLLDQISSLSDQEITAGVINSALGLPQTQALEELLGAYEANNNTKIEEILKNLLNTGLKPETIASELISSIIANPQPGFLPLLAKLPEVQPPFPEAKLLLSFLLKNVNTTPISPARPTTASATTPVTTSVKPSSTKAALAQKIAQSRAKNASTRPPEAIPEAEPPHDQALAEKSPETPPAGSSEALEANPSSKASSTTPSQPFAWKSFLERIHSQNDAIYAQLQKVDYEFDGQTLHLYPEQKFTKTILEKPNNLKIIHDCLDGSNAIVHDLGERQAPKDETLSQISAIMGDIREVKGEMPF